MSDKREDLLEDTFLEPSTIKVATLQLRPFSPGTRNLARKLKLTMFLGGADAGALTPDEQHDQMMTFAWMQSFDLATVVLPAVRDGSWKALVEEFGLQPWAFEEFAIRDLMREVKRIANRAAAAVAEIDEEESSESLSDKKKAETGPVSEAAVVNDGRPV